MKETQLTLLDRLREGAEEADWKDFFNAYWRPMFVFALGRGCSEEDAGDAVQEMMLEVFRKRTVFHYDPAKGRFRNWLFTVLVRKIAATARKRRSNVSIDATDLLPNSPDPGVLQQFEDLFERGLLAALLKKVRQEVEPSTYQAFELTAVQDLGGNEAAALTGLTRDAVYSARRRVLNRLRELGAPYADDGVLGAELKKLVDFFPSDSVERGLTRTVQEALESSANSQE